MVERLASSDASLTDLRLTEAPQAYCKGIDELIEAFQSNTVVSYVRLDRDFLPSLSQSEDADKIPLLLSAIGALPKLQESLLWHASLDMKALTAFVVASQGKQLQSLQLGFLDLTGNEQDLQDLADALQTGHDNLQSFDMIDFSLNDDTLSLDPVIESLSKLQNLTRVKSNRFYLCLPFYSESLGCVNRQNYGSFLTSS